jgi:Family of unknown function (DUF6338)
MSLSSFLIRIILLVIPGIIGSLLYRNVRGRAARKDWEDYLEILVFSFLSYLAYALVVYILSKKYSVDPFAAFRALTNESIPIDARIGHAIFFSSLISVPVAFVASYVDEYKLINRFARLIKASERFGDEDVWDYFRRSPDTKWVYVRDLRNDIYYYGWIQAWSDPYKERELLLREVDVYKSSTAEFLYTSDVVYISRKQDDLTIEADLVSNRFIGDGQEAERRP